MSWLDSAMDDVLLFLQTKDRSNFEPTPAEDLIEPAEEILE